MISTQNVFKHILSRLVLFSDCFKTFYSWLLAFPLSVNEHKNYDNISNHAIISVDVWKASKKKIRVELYLIIMKIFDAYSVMVTQLPLE
jgi:hypothetical protein